MHKFAHRLTSLAFRKSRLADPPVFSGFDSSVFQSKDDVCQKNVRKFVHKLTSLSLRKFSTHLRKVLKK